MQPHMKLEAQLNPWKVDVTQAVSSMAARIHLSFGRIITASNSSVDQGPAWQERIGTTFDRLLTATFNVSLQSALVLQEMVDWDIDNPPWAVFEYDYLDMEQPNCLSQFLLDAIHPEDWATMAEDCMIPSIEIKPEQMLNDFIFAWATQRELPLVRRESPTMLIKAIAAAMGLTLDIRKHYGGPFVTVYLEAPQGLPWQEQQARLQSARDKINDRPEVGRPVLTRFNNPPKFMRHSGKMDPGHPRHGDPLLEIDSFVWED